MRPQNWLKANEVRNLAMALAEATSRTLGDRLAGVVLHGSFVLGDYLPGCSDLDLLAVVDGALTDGERAVLGEAARQVRPPTGLRVDLRLVTRAVAGAPEPSPRAEAYLTISGSRAPRVRVEGRHPERDLVVEFSFCRAHGHGILGASPAELIGEVSDRAVLDVGDAQLADWQAIGEDPPYAQLTVLTACRVWRFAEERKHCSKGTAGEWALRRAPSLDVVRDALDQRYRDRGQGIDAAQVHALLVQVRGRVAEVREARTMPSSPEVIRRGAVSRG